MSINTWKDLYNSLNIEEDNKINLQEYQDTDEIPDSINDDMVRNPFEYLSGYSDHKETIELGKRPIDICFNWNPTDTDIPAKDDIDTFLNNYKLENLNKHNTDDKITNIKLTED